MTSFASYRTLEYMFHKRSSAESSPFGAHQGKLDQRGFDDAVGRNNDSIISGINRRCRCSVKDENMVLNNWKVFTFPHGKEREATKTSASNTIHQIETDMAVSNKSSGQANVLLKWLQTREYEIPPDDYECKECLEGKVEIDPEEKRMHFEQDAIDEESRDGIFLLKPLLRPSFRRNPFKEVQLCPHFLENVINQPRDKMKIQRKNNLIDFIKAQAELNQTPEEPRVNIKRLNSEVYETLLKSREHPRKPSTNGMQSEDLRYSGWEESLSPQHSLPPESIFYNYQDDKSHRTDMS
ncbi:hypothetical protein GE061_010211 [Apolygus lucorum]|uniref:Uncharacterized protein n=1 Tax=Apolygus lucorum TaxID=248454 RepID=A0A8S9Y4G2_APOLU|nr:hypothetical protein GE061_010211 [Apolygus lucorum]